MNAKDKISAAKIIIIRSLPYLSHVVSMLKLHETRETPTMAVSKSGIVYYNPDFVDSTETKGIAAVLVHEALHLLRQHHIRMLDYSHFGKEIINIATDMEINDDLISSDLSLPATCVHPSTYGLPVRRTAEEYTIMLAQNGKIGDAPQNSSSGSCATGIPERWENDEEEKSSPRAFAIRGAINSSIRERMRGTMPQKITEETGIGKSTIISRIAAEINRTRVYSRPKRRNSTKFFYPSTKKDARILVIRDTSGSMSAQILSDIAANIIDMARKFSNVIMIECDADVQHITRDLSRKNMRLARGRGGSDLRPAFEKANGFRPDLILVFTDGYTEWPNKCDIKTICIINTDAKIPSWCKAIRWKEKNS